MVRIGEKRIQVGVHPNKNKIDLQNTNQEMKYHAITRSQAFLSNSSKHDSEKTRFSLFLAHLHERQQPLLFVLHNYTKHSLRTATILQRVPKVGRHGARQWFNT